MPALAISIPLIGAAVAAILGAIVWRFQLIGQRRFQVAEEAIVAFTMANDAIMWARSPAGYTNEGQSRPGRDEEDEKTAKARDTYYRTLERLHEGSSKFAELRRIQILSTHHLGSQAGEAFRTLFDVRSNVQIAAEMLLMDAGTEPVNQDSREFRVAMHKEIWARGTHDPLGDRLDAAEKTLTTICDRYARLSAAFWPFATPVRKR